MPRSIFFSSSYIVPLLQKLTWYTGQGKTPQSSIHPPSPPAASGASIHCHRNRCKTCPFITEGTTSYTFFSTNEQRRIRHHITCSSSESHRNACYATWAISDHFTLLSHSVDNIELVPLELTTSNDSNRDAIRKERETFLISKANFSFNII